jgi:uncharacterized membrane protein YbhN (UPF0104 family)
VRLGALALIVFLALRLYRLWEERPVDFSDANLLLLSCAAVVSFVAVVAYGAVWPLILRRLGAPAPRDSIGLFLQSQLGKYLPGGVWQYAGRVELARVRGVPVRSSVLSLGIEVAASAFAAGAIGLFVLPPALAVPLALAAIAVLLVVAFGGVERLFQPLVRLVRRLAPIPAADLRASRGALPLIALLYVPVWALYGLALWLTGRAFFPIGADEVLFFTAAFALGWLAGMVVVFAPGGIGVREAVLVGLLAPRVGEAEAIVIAGTSRILLVAADLAGGSAAFALSQRRRIRPAPDRGRA